MGLGMLGDGNIKCGFNFVWENFFKISLFNWIDLELERVVILLLSIVIIDNVVGIVVVVDKIWIDYNVSIFIFGVGFGVYV